MSAGMHDGATFRHTTVLLDEAVDGVLARPDGVYVDGTFGRGGHSRLLLSKLGPQGRLIGNSIPAADLRADSPSLPANQQDAAGSARPAALITTDSIQIQPSGK